MDQGNQGWQVELQCPQCGGPVVLEETDHILACSFCRVRLFISCPNYPRYFMAPRCTSFKDVFFLPYWRFKGLAFTCHENEVRQRIVDSSLLALRAVGLPLSLGVRPQVLKLKFATPETDGRFLKPHFPFKTLPSKSGAGAGPVADPGKSFPGFYEAFIGETLSLIYSPVVIEKGLLCDAILRQPLARVPEDVFEKLPSDNSHHHAIRFIPTLCPHCGWDLEGEKDTLLLLCRNCDSGWVSSPDGLKRQEFTVFTQTTPHPVVYLPFWRLKAEIFGVKLRSVADLTRLANLPRAITSAMEERGAFFRIPAFKVQPHLFLRLAKLLTISQKFEDIQELHGRWPKSDTSKLFPVTLPVHEAAESIAMTMTSFVVPKPQFISRLHEIKVKLLEYTLVYLPFEARGSELIQPEMQISISANALRLGRLI
jgi:hypothetical protein